MTRHLGHLQIIHARAAKARFAEDKAAGFDDIHGHAQTGAQADERRRILGDIGFEKRQPHLTITVGEGSIKLSVQLAQTRRLSFVLIATFDNKWHLSSKV